MAAVPDGHNNSRDEDVIAHQAATWFARLLDEQAPPSEHRNFRAWLQQDERNARAYARIEQLWTQAAAEPFETELQPPRRRFLKTAGAIVLLAGSGSAWRLATRPEFSTSTGEIRTVVLADGSHVELAAKTSISTDFRPSSRRVILHGGEAYFSVASDPSRPFVVEAGPLRATALGTAYCVAIKPERTSVAVSRHSVRVETENGRIELSEGDAVDWTNGMLGSVATGEADARLGWRARQLVFLARPLGELATEVNRWRKGRLVILDPQLAMRKVTAIIDLNDIAGIDRTLQQGLPITLTDYTSMVTLVTGRK